MHVVADHRLLQNTVVTKEEDNLLGPQINLEVKNGLKNSVCAHKI